MLLAEAVYKDRDTGKTVLAGIFDEIVIERPDTRFTARASLYLSLTNVLGDVDFVFRYIDLSTNEILHEYKRIVVKSEDRLAGLEVTVPLPFLPVPHAGYFAMELYSAEELVGSLRIRAHVT